MLVFFVGNLVLSVGIGMSVEAIKQAYDKNSGVPKKQLEIRTTCMREVSAEDVAALYEKIAGYGEVQLVSLDTVELNTYEKECQVVPVCFQKKEDWHIPMISGSYFSIQEIQDCAKQVIIGKDIAAENKIKQGDTVQVNAEDYQVVGICGRSNRGTKWDNVIYVPWNDFKEHNADYLKAETIYGILKSGKDAFVSDFFQYEEEAKEIGIELTYAEFQIQESDSVENSILLTVLAAVLVFTIAIINITNLMIYWMLERKKDLAVLKALGADNRYLTRCLVAEIVVMTVLSAFLAVIVQVIITEFFDEWLINNEIYCTVTYVNFMISFVITTVCGFAAAIWPAKQVMRIQPAEGIR